MTTYELDDTQPLDLAPLLRDPPCRECGKGTSRHDRPCLDCEQAQR